MRNWTRGRIILVIGVVVTLYSNVGYSQSTYSFEFDSSSLKAVLLEIEENTTYSFFFKEEWTEDVIISKSYAEKGLKDILDDLLQSAGINYMISDDKVILTGDVKLTTQLIYDSSTLPYQVGYVFEREYRGDQDEIISVGNRSKMKTGANAVIAGFVKDEEGEGIPSAVVYAEESEISTVSDLNGFYSINLPTGEHTLLVQFSGMKAKRQKIVLFSSGSLNIDLEEEPRILDEVTIVAEGSAGVNNVRMGTNTLNMESIKNVPKLMGENDMIQAALTLPGVQNVGEGSAGINVRGGKTDQNLILLNHATVYNPFHYFGFFSSFNADITGNLELMKSGIPSTYGGRLSSLLNVTMKRADKNQFGAKLAINPITTSASMELPIIKDKTAVMAGIRTTYADWVTKNAKNEAIRNSDPRFSDLAFNINHSYGKVNSINVSAYYSKDSYKLSTDSTNSYSNSNVAVEWKHLINENLSASVIGAYVNYAFDIEYDQRPESAFRYGFRINEAFSKILLNYFPSDRHDLSVGTDAKLYHLSPGKMLPIGDSEVEKENVERERGIEQAVFVSEEFILSQRVTLYGGLRYSFFTPLGSRNINYYQEGVPRNSGSLTETRTFKSGEKIDTYHGPEFRFSAKYSLSPNSSIKFGVTQMRQYIHAISNTISVSPTDTWKLTDPNISPQTAVQYSFGYYKTLFADKVSASVETYYKKLNNLLDYKVGADLVLNENLETEVLQGDGRAYGVELLLSKDKGRLNGWLSYAFSRSQQKFKTDYAETTINGGKYFPSNFEKPHSLSVVSNYKHTRRVSSSINVVFASGRPVTYPTAKYQLGGVEVTHFSDRNSFRLPNYFRVDLALSLEGNHRLDKPGHGYWSFSIYNVLARKNVYSIFFTNEGGEIKGYQLSVLGSAIPSITYNVKF